MAKGKKSKKPREGPKKGEEGKCKAIEKLVDSRKQDPNKSTPATSAGHSQVSLLAGSSGSVVRESKKAFSSVRPSAFSTASSKAPSSTTSVSFSESANPLAPSSVDGRPLVNLAPGNGLQLRPCPLPIRTSCQLLRYIGVPPKPPKPVIPGLPQDSRCREPNHLIKDRRHDNGDLVRLPKESDVQRTPNFIRTGCFRFLDLPAEIRNQIYDYLIGPECYFIHWVNKNRKTRLLTYSLPHRSGACQPRMCDDTLSRRQLLKINPRNVKRKDLMIDQYRHHSPVALLWVSRKMYEEASSMFYSKSTFAFDLLGTLRHFMNTLTVNNKASITKLKIIYKAYGHPAKTNHQIWKIKADHAWESLCWRISSECTSITHLTLDLDYQYSKLQFVSFFEASRNIFGTDWMMALWAFDDLNLKRCACRIRSAISLDAELEVASYNVRKVLLGEAWDDKTEEDKDAFGFNLSKNGKQKKNAAILRITRTGEVFGLA